MKHLTAFIRLYFTHQLIQNILSKTQKSDVDGGDEEEAGTKIFLCQSIDHVQR